MHAAKFLVLFMSLLLSSITSIYSDCPHYIYLGPDVYYRDYSEKDLQKDGKSDEYGVLSGLQLGYDYIKEEDIYFGIDARGSAGRTVYDGSLIHLDDGLVTPYKNHTMNFIFNGEARLGYTFDAAYTITVTPFIGYGYHYWFRGSVPENPYGYDEAYMWSYLALGVRSTYPLCKDWLIGLNLKIMHMIDGRMKSSTLSNTAFKLGNVLQYEVEVPITHNLIHPFYLINQIQLVPYFRNQNIGRSNNQSAVLHFSDGTSRVFTIHEPRSVTYVAGILLKCVHNF